MDENLKPMDSMSHFVFWRCGIFVLYEITNFRFKSKMRFIR